MTWQHSAIQRLTLIITASVLAGTALQAQDTERQFVEGLRERGYFDTAVEYLDQLEQQPGLSPEFRTVLDLERGLTFQQMGAASRVPEDREQYLTQAETALTRFLGANPGHEQAAFANATLGELLFDRARTFIWQADAESQPENRATLQAQARNLIDQAEAIYTTARDQYKSQFDAFPAFVDESRDEDLFQQKRAVEIRYLRAWYNVNRCMYERGLTYDQGSEQRKATLIKAADLFDQIYSSYRTVPIGMHARLMMGRCYQQHDDVGRALGLYQEYLDNRSTDAIAQEVRSVAQHYRLICLNHPDRAGYELVLQEATEWLQAHRNQLSTQTGLGILWEKAIAEEKLAAVRTADPKQRELLLRQAQEDAQLVARYPGAYREPANALNRRVKALLGDQDREPRDFETAFERARGMIDQIQQLKDELERAASDEQRREKTTALTLYLDEVGRLLRMALDLRDDNTDPKAIAQTHYLLSYVYFRQRKNFDAVIMARHCLVSDRSADPDTALNATEIAISAAVQAWNDAPEDNRQFETLLLRDVCEEIISLYPQSTRGNEARIRLGRVYQQLGEALEAARWFLQVPETDPQYASARISAGQAFWMAWTAEAAGLQDGQTEQHSAQDMQTWKNEAQQLLQDGIARIRATVGTDTMPPAEVTAGEVSLASILNLNGDYQQAIDRLTSGEEFSVLKAIEVPEGSARPDKGVQSASFAGLTLRLLMRAYVGTQQVDNAIATMASLEQVGSQDTAAVYTQLGIELQEELKRLRSAGETQRLTEVRQSFERFLEEVYKRRNPGDYNSLLWIGETYFGLGQGVGDDAAAAAAYYEKAATAYQSILDGQLADGETVTAIQLRLARCRRAQSRFQDGLEIALSILRNNPMTLDAQVEAARLLADWGSAGTPEKLLESITGIRENEQRVVWGWSDMARRLQQSVATEPSEEFRERFLEARYELSKSRLRYAKASGPDSETQLKNGIAEIAMFAQVERRLDDAWWSRFDQLYQNLQTELGQVAKPLERPAVIQAATPPTPEVNMQPDSSTETAAQQVAAATEPESGGWLLPTLAVCLAAGAAGGFYVLLNRQPARRRLPGTSGASPFSPDSGLDATAMPVVGPRKSRSPAAAAATKPAARPRPAKLPDSGSAQRPAGSGDSEPQRRPAPPSPKPAPPTGERTPRKPSPTRKPTPKPGKPPDRPE